MESKAFYALVIILAYTFGVLFLGNQDKVFLSLFNNGENFENLLNFLPFIFLIIAGILMISYLRYFKGEEKRKLTKNYDKMVYLVGVVGPLASIPQIIHIFFHKNATGISITSWTIYMLFAFVWLGYGVLHRYKPIIVTNSLWIIFESIIILGAVLY